MVEDVVYADTVVQNLHQIGHLHRLEGHRHLALLEDGFHLLPGQPVACHAAGAVGQIDLDIVVQPVIAFLLFLPEQLLCQCRENQRLFYTRFYFHRSLGIFWNQPCAFARDRAGGAPLSAKAADNLTRGFPPFSGFLNCHVTHKKSFLSCLNTFGLLHLKNVLQIVPERIPESRRNTMHQLIYNGFLCDMIGHIGLFRSKIFIDIHYGTHGIQEVSGSIPLISTKKSLLELFGSKKFESFW